MAAPTEILLKPGQQIKPFVPNDVVYSLVNRLYGLEVSSVKELNSYDDRNFHISVKSNSPLADQEDACDHGYILKVLNSLDSKAPKLVEAQNEMMLFLGKQGISCPRPVKNVHGNYMALEELKIQVDDIWLENNDGGSRPTGQHLVRLLSFIPGQILFSVPYTPDLFYQVGEMVARTDLALRDFHHEGLVGVNRIWNLSSVPKLGEFAYAVQDEANRALAMAVIDNFKSCVVTHYGTLEAGPIHGDFNEQNILVRESGDSKTYAVAGILDFGDIHHNFYLFELAIAICYMMIECQSMDILDAPGHVLAGYNRLRRIPDHEFQLLKDCICGRFCQSLVLGAYSYAQNPDPYVLTTSKRGWYCLDRLWKAPKDELGQRWRAIMDQYAEQ